MRRRRKFKEIRFSSATNTNEKAIGVLSVHFVRNQLVVWFKSGCFVIYQENFEDFQTVQSKYVGFCRADVLPTQRLTVRGEHKSQDVPPFIEEKISNPKIPMPPESVPKIPKPPISILEHDSNLNNLDLNNVAYANKPFLALIPNSTDTEYHGIDVINNLNHRVSRSYLQNEGVSMSCKFFNQDSYLVGYESGKIVKFSTKTDKILATNQVTKPGIPIMTMSCYDTKIVVGSSENTIYKLDSELNICSKIEFTNCGLNDLFILQDNSDIFVSLGWDNRIRVFDHGKNSADSICKLAVINCDEYLHDGNLQSGLFLKEKGWLITSSMDGRISVWKNFVKRFLK